MSRSDDRLLSQQQIAGALCRMVWKYRMQQLAIIEAEFEGVMP